jgi:pyruvate formate lyase activating enzyme
MTGDFRNIAKLLPFLDDVYADIKHIDSDEHKRLTGGPNDAILRNIETLAASGFGGNIRIRLPMIPAVNMSPENIRGVAEFCRGLKRLAGIELLPYHRLGIDTYRRLNREYKLPHVSIPSRHELDTAADIIKKIIPGVEIRY